MLGIKQSSISGRGFWYLLRLFHTIGKVVVLRLWLEMEKVLGYILT